MTRILQGQLDKEKEIGSRARLISSAFLPKEPQRDN